ncbi:hypothetical protein PXNS11_310125 [Stutzerimonas xanthomarina]|nr:hypothetical protein PXNS11_310125 [Stutzerimonas xanthomarina]
MRALQAGAQPLGPFGSISQQQQRHGLSGRWQAASGLGDLKDGRYTPDFPHSPMQTPCLLQRAQD